MTSYFFVASFGFSSPDFARWYPAFCASASVIYWPCLVLPYHSSPSLWPSSTCSPTLCRFRLRVPGESWMDRAEPAWSSLPGLARIRRCRLRGRRSLRSLCRHANADNRNANQPGQRNKNRFLDHAAILHGTFLLAGAQLGQNHTPFSPRQSRSEPQTRSLRRLCNSAVRR